MRKITLTDKEKYDVLSAYKFKQRMDARNIRKNELLFYLATNYSLDYETLENKSISLIYLEYKKECWRLIELKTQKRRTSYEIH